MSKDSNKEERVRSVLKKVLSILALLLIIFFVWITFGWWVDNVLFDPGMILDASDHNPQKTLSELKGQFGDKFGAINSLFSGLAFAVLICTLFLQMEELADTREVLEQQKNEFLKQNANLKQQRFENTFFQMLENFSRVTIGLRGRVVTGAGDKKDFTGAQMLHALVSCVHRGLKADFMYPTTTPINTFNEKITTVLRNEWDECSERRVTVYLNMVLQIVDFIERENVKDQFSGDPALYMDVFKCSLSIDEMEALYLFAPLHPGKRLAPLLKKYNFFDGVFECFGQKTQAFKFLH